MKILVTGHKGMLGSDLLPQLVDAGFDVIGLDVDELDITNPDNISRHFEAIQPELVINCAAYTAVDKAESGIDVAFAVNRDGPKNLAQACRTFLIPLIHISTDYVFDGTIAGAYCEDDPINPLGVYGASKWEGEECVRSCLEQHVIIRTSWLYGIKGNNFVKTMIRLSKERDEIKVVSDQHGCPTWTKDLADAIVEIAAQISRDKNRTPWGTYHFCGDGRTTWYDFTRFIIMNKERKESAERTPKITPIETCEYPTPAKRPACSALDCSKITEKFGIKPRRWEDALELMIEELYKGQSS
jgi:dTDP-4-dehydrorhamnose reductase